MPKCYCLGCCGGVSASIPARHFWLRRVYPRIGEIGVER
ncbi:hypothetical protein RintRC_4965 [Richelia intracellularis]|nr:hypothetical protein RintRC_4965 [Richelia intracellularis]